MNGSDTNGSLFIVDTLPQSAGYGLDPLGGGDILRFEAEELNLNNYVTEINQASSSGENISLFGGGSNSGTATEVFNGEAGIYKVKVGYYDENDGASFAQVTVAGDTQNFFFDQNLGSGGATSGTLTERDTHSEILLRPGDNFEIKANYSGGEPARFDYIDFVFVQTVRYEVEDLTLHNYQVESNTSSSGGENVKVLNNNPATATGVFDGESGFYQVKVGYYDEGDGISKATVTVDGISNSFQFDENNDPSSGGPTSDNLTEHITHSVISLENGDSFEIKGHSNSGEYARFDYIEFIPVQNPYQPNGTLRYEAEALELRGYQIESTNTVASGGQQISLLGTGSNVGTATSIFTGEAGIYRVKVGYYDENDGVASANITVAGQTRNFLFEEDLGKNVAVPGALTSRVTNSIIGLQPGDAFEIEGNDDGGEPARFDFIDFIPVEATVEAQTVIRYEVEDLTLNNYQKESNSNSSGGENVKVQNNNRATATGVFDGETRFYQVKVGYYDENDGISKAKVTVAGQSRSFEFDGNLPLDYPKFDNLIERISHSAVKLKSGDSFEIEATSNFAEYARFDYIEFVAVNPPATSTYYVSREGSDNNLGTIDQPWKTINYAVSKNSSVEAGDTILVQPGVYTELITLDKSGNDELGHIILKADGNVTLRDPDAINGGFREGVIQSADKGYWIIDGFRIENTSWAGISLRDANNMIVQNNHTYETGASGIIIMPDTFFGGGEAEVTSRDIKVLGNTVERANWRWTGRGDNNGTQEALSIWGVDGFEVANNFVNEGTREGIDIKTGSRNGSVHNNTVTGVAQVSGLPEGYKGGPAIYIEGNRSDTFNVDVYNNIVYNNVADGIVVADEVPAQGDVRDIRVYNNVVYGNGTFGKNGGVGIGVNSNVTDVKIINNTVVNNVQSILIDGSDFFRGYKTTNVIVRNNIFANAIFSNGRIEDADDVVLDNNLFTNGFTNLYEGGNGLNNFVETNNTQVISIGFVDSQANDYHLSSTSAAIDIGSALLPSYASIDKDGIQRDKDGDADGNPEPDVGAYEYLPHS